MYWNRKHVLVCTAQHCIEKGALNVAGRMRIAMRRSGLDADVLVNTCDSIDLCDCGPNMIVYPEKAPRERMPRRVSPTRKAASPS